MIIKWLDWGVVKIGFISTWAQGIIVSVIIATIIEMILPNSNNSKYIKMVIGVFILFSIVSPVINKISGNNNSFNLDRFSKYETNETIETSSSIDNNELIKQMYEENLKIDMKAKISQKGYSVGDIDVEVLNNNEFTLNSIKMKIVGSEKNQGKSGNNQRTTTIVENVENILVSVSGKKSNNTEKEKSAISESEKRKLVQYLSSVYEVKESNIYVY